MLNNRGAVDARSILTGKDGVILNGNGKLLATVESFQSQVNVNNAKYQPLGDMQEHEAPQSYAVTLTISQVVIKSDELIQEFMEGLITGKMPNWNFQGLVQGRNGSEERINYRSCIPSGSVDLQNLSVGDVIKRAWSFTVNQPPKLQSLLG